MPKFDDYTQKTTPEDTDIALILDKTANVNKKTPFSGIWTWIVNKMTNAVIQNLQTSNKTMIGAINELNSKSITTDSIYVLKRSVQGNNQLKFKSMYDSFGAANRQTVFIWGSSNPDPIYGLITIIGSDGSCIWNGTGEITVSSADDGEIIITFTRNVYDEYVLLSSARIL